MNYLVRVVTSLEESVLAPSIVETGIRTLGDLVEFAAASGTELYGASRLGPQDCDWRQRLYTFRRDLQVREVPGSGLGRTGTTWRADEVHYECGRLPSGEAVRSLGHWNPSDQLEIFEVLSGSVIMGVASPGPAPATTFRRYDSGDTCVIAPGAYHVTYSPWVPSVVFNVYNETPAHDIATKYLGSTLPPGHVVFTEAGLTTSPELIDGPPTDEPSLPRASVVDLLPSCLDAELDDLFRRFMSWQ